MLVLAPTRELAIQVSKDFKDITKKLSVHCFYGGSSYNPQGITEYYSETHDCYGIGFQAGSKYFIKIKDNVPKKEKPRITLLVTPRSLRNSKPSVVTHVNFLINTLCEKAKHACSRIMVEIMTVFNRFTYVKQMTLI